MLKYEFAHPDLERLQRDPNFTGGFAPAIVRAFRRRIEYIRDAKDERDLYFLKSYRFEKHKGKRRHQRSMRLNDQWRLILEIRKDAGGNVVVVVSIEDYH